MKKDNEFFSHSNAHFCQIGFQRGMALTLMLDNDNQMPFRITIIEELFTVFIPWFFN